MLYLRDPLRITYTDGYFAGVVTGNYHLDKDHTEACADNGCFKSASDRLRRQGPVWKGVLSKAFDGWECSDWSESSAGKRSRQSVRRPRSRFAARLPLKSDSPGLTNPNKADTTNLHREIEMPVDSSRSYVLGSAVLPRPGAYQAPNPGTAIT